MIEMFVDFKEFYWAHREAFRMAGAGLVFVCAQAVILLWTLRRLGELSNIRERMSRLADGLALLTDTTEAGFATVARQLDQANRGATAGSAAKPAARAVARRVKNAARQGDPIGLIAAREALSESETRLHLALAKNDRTADPDRGDQFSPLAS